MATKAILFDFGGTLDFDGVTWADRFFPIYREAGIRAEKDAFYKAFWNSDDHLPLRHDLDGLGLEQTVSLQVRDVLHELAPERPEIAETVVRRFVEQSRWHFRRNRDFLEPLRRRFKLGIVSNFYGNLQSVLNSEGLGGLFDAIADSEVVGAKKPEPGIFQHVLRSFGVEPSEAIMVGDSIARDMRGAERLGMPHALLHPDANPCCGQAKRISSLTQLEELLG
ncbi:MAG: HAD family hydrolase [Elusimicrobia bacterium]|nr:HAD family hydrolase [Elusimicrobiota bacterium]